MSRLCKFSTPPRGPGRRRRGAWQESDLLAALGGAVAGRPALLLLTDPDASAARRPMWDDARMIEIERRFLVDALPEPLPRPVRIVQGYLMTEPAAVRVRSADGQYTLTIKSGSGLRRTEIERALGAAEFDALWEVATDLRIEKRRHRIDLDHGAVAELDLFDGALAGRRLVEVEFEEEASASSFVAPTWFGREVTTDDRYTNAALARNGWPD